MFCNTAEKTLRLLFNSQKYRCALAINPNKTETKTEIATEIETETVREVVLEVCSCLVFTITALP